MLVFFWGGRGSIEFCAVENMKSFRILRLLRFLGYLVLRGSFNGGVVWLISDDVQFAFRC